MADVKYHNVLTINYGTVAKRHVKFQIICLQFNAITKCIFPNICSTEVPIMARENKLSLVSWLLKAASPPYSWNFFISLQILPSSPLDIVLIQRCCKLFTNDSTSLPYMALIAHKVCYHQSMCLLWGAGGSKEKPRGRDQLSQSLWDEENKRTEEARAGTGAHHDRIEA